MNSLRTGLFKFAGAMVLASIAAVPAFAADRIDPEKEDFSGIGKAVMQVLVTRDVTNFVNAVSPTVQDMRALRKPAEGDTEVEFAANVERSVEFQRQRLKSSAEALLQSVDRMKLDFSGERFEHKVVPPRFIGSIRYSSSDSGDGTPWAEKIDVVITPKPGATNLAERLRGEYRVSARNLVRIPAKGWTLNETVQWVAFPAGVVDDQTERELLLVAKVGSREPLTSEEDPALKTLAASLAQYIQNGDLGYYESNVMLSFDLVWEMTQSRATVGMPSRETVRKQWDERVESMREPAIALVKQMEKAGVDLKNSTVRVKEASVKSVQSANPGNASQLYGRDLKVVLAVESPVKAKSGAALSGEYTLASDAVMRLGGRWVVAQAVRWQEMPEGVLDAETQAALTLDNYVAEHGTLPVGSAAPEIRMFDVNDEREMALSSLKGKVVVLEFWATWCGPCQDPMAKMQTYHNAHPNWRDQVELVALSIDDELQTVRNHLNKRGWTNTFNVWAGKGGWQSGAPKAFRVSGVPTCYVLDAEGKIVRAGHPVSMELGSLIDGLLAKKK